MESFKSNPDDRDINRVILYSKKSKTPPVFKVLTSYFRDRFRFGFVSAEAAPDLVPSATDLP
jgi:hypothetical protein